MKSIFLLIGNFDLCCQPRFIYLYEVSSNIYDPLIISGETFSSIRFDNRGSFKFRNGYEITEKR